MESKVRRKKKKKKKKMNKLLHNRLKKNKNTKQN